MGIVCQCCKHPERRKMDYDLVNGIPATEVAKRYGVSWDSAKRHRQNHIPKTMAAQLEQEHTEKVVKRDAAIAAVAQRHADEMALEGAEEADRLLGHIRYLHRKSLAILETAKNKNPTLALKAIREARETVRLMGEVLGELNGAGTTVNILNAPQWVQLQNVIVTALEPFPEAREAVLRAVEEAEG